MITDCAANDEIEGEAYKEFVPPDERTVDLVNLQIENSH